MGNVTAPDHLKQIISNKTREAVNMDDYGIFAAKEDNVRLALCPGYIQNAIDLATAGWPIL